MLVKKVSVILPLVVLFSMNAFATTVSCGTRSFALFNFSQYAYGKSVVGVVVHVGLQRQDKFGGHNGSYWACDQHFPLTHKNGHFFGKALVDCGYSPMGQNIDGLAVNYTVYFADRSSMTTPTTYNNGFESVDSELDSSQSIKDTAIWFNSISDAQESKTINFSRCIAD